MRIDPILEGSTFEVCNVYSNIIRVSVCDSVFNKLKMSTEQGWVLANPRMNQGPYPFIVINLAGKKFREQYLVRNGDISGNKRSVL